MIPRLVIVVALAAATPVFAQQQSAPPQTPAADAEDQPVSLRRTDGGYGLANGAAVGERARGRDARADGDGNEEVMQHIVGDVLRRQVMAEVRFTI